MEKYYYKLTCSSICVEECPIEGVSCKIGSTACVESCPHTTRTYSRDEKWIICNKLNEYLKSKEMKKMFSKLSIESGMKVLTRNHGVYLVMEVPKEKDINDVNKCKGLILLNDNKGWMNLDGYNANLEYKDGERRWDIMKVYKTRHYMDLFNFDINSHVNKEIWSREPKIEITCIVNGKETKLSDISEETLLNIRKNN